MSRTKRVTMQKADDSLKQIFYLLSAMQFKKYFLTKQKCETSIRNVPTVSSQNSFSYKL